MPPRIAAETARVRGLGACALTDCTCHVHAREAALTMCSGNKYANGWNVHDSTARPASSDPGRRPLVLHPDGAPARRHRAGPQEADRDDLRRSQGGDAGVRGRQAGRGQGIARHLSEDPRLRRAAQGDRRLDPPALQPGQRRSTSSTRCCPSTARAKACSSRRCRPSGARASSAGPSSCSPIRSTRPTSAAPTPPTASRSTSTPPPRPGICPISMRSRASPTSCGAPRPSSSARPPTRRARSPAPTTSPRRWRWRASTTSCCSWTSATRRSTSAPMPRPAACRWRPRRPSASRT